MVPPVDGFPRGSRPRVRSPFGVYSNLSFGSGAQGPLRFTGSPVHVSAPFEAQAPGPVSSQLSSNDGLEEPFKVAGFLSAFARRHSLLGHPVPAREFRSPHSRPTDPPPGR